MSERVPPSKTMKIPAKTTDSMPFKRIVLVVGPIFCLSVCILQPAGAFLHCFTPNMFKMGKIGHPGTYPGSGHPGERANWYPGAYSAYGQNPMSRLFKPKWMGGGMGGLLGPKRWMDWRINAANMNFYRPTQAAYWPPPAPSSYLGGGTPSYNQFSDSLNLPAYPASLQLIQPPTSSTPASSYGQSQSSQPSNTNIHTNDGWSYPSVSPYSRPGSGGSSSGGGGGSNRSGQLSYGSGDSYSVSPNSYQSSKQQMDSYGTKGGSGTKTGKK